MCGVSGVRRSPTPNCLSYRCAAGAHCPLAVAAGGAGVGTRHQPHSARSGELALRAVGAARGRPGGAPSACVWGVQCWALPHARPPVLGACGRSPLPTGCGCWGCRRGDPSPTPQRALSRAGFARHGGSMKAPRGGACCRRVGRLRLGALTRPTACPWGVRPGPATHWLWVRCAGVGARLSWAPSPVPRFVPGCARFPGLPRPEAVVAWNLSSCRRSGGQGASLACLVALRWCAAPRCSGRLYRCRWCLPLPGELSPPALLGGYAGHLEAGREPGSLCLRLAPAEARALGSLCVVPVRGPTMGLSLAGPSGFRLGLRALRWFGACGPRH